MVSYAPAKLLEYMWYSTAIAARFRAVCSGPSALAMAATLRALCSGVSAWLIAAMLRVRCSGVRASALAIVCRFRLHTGDPAMSAMAEPGPGLATVLQTATRVSIAPVLQAKRCFRHCLLFTTVRVVQLLANLQIN